MPCLFQNELLQKKNCHCLAVHLHTICRDLFTQWVFFSKLCGKKRQQFLFCGQRTEEFIKLFPNKEIISDKIQLALKR